jgi:hypothetical protein
LASAKVNDSSALSRALVGCEDDLEGAQGVFEARLRHVFAFI